MYTDRVPYHGLVEWDEERVRAYAEMLAAEHRPRRRFWIVGKQYCRACGTVWQPCFAAMWSLGLLKHDLDDGVVGDVLSGLLAIATAMAAFVIFVVIV